MSAAEANLDKDLLDTMTPEERAAIADADESEITSLQNKSGAVKEDIETAAGGKSDDDDEDDDKDDDGAGAAAESQPAAAAPAAQPAADAETAASSEAAAPEQPQAPQGFAFQYELPEDYEERLTANKTAKEELYQKLKEGEITLEEMQAEASKLDDERRELDGMRIQRDIAEQTQRQLMEQRRQAAIENLYKTAAKPEGGGIDYRADAAKLRDLDTFVRALAADEANADKSLDWFLAEGHRRVRALHGVTATPAATPAKAADRKPPLEDIPKTLAHVPGGDGPGDVGGEFDDILGLEGEAYEQAIANLAKTNPTRFARFQSSSQ